MADTTKETPKNFARLPGRWQESAQIQQDRRKPKRLEADRRGDEIIVVDTQASLRVSFENSIEGNLDNLSLKGCSLDLAGSSLGVGDAVWFTIESLQPWKGTVRWVNGTKVGVEFDRPFYRGVFELLVQLNKSVNCSKAA